MTNLNILWLLGGDFNAFVTTEEHRGALSETTQPMLEISPVLFLITLSLTLIFAVLILPGLIVSRVLSADGPG